MKQLVVTDTVVTTRTIDVDDEHYGFLREDMLVYGNDLTEDQLAEAAAKYEREADLEDRWESIMTHVQDGPDSDEVKHTVEVKIIDKPEESLPPTPALAI